ncbi:MAG: PQQ-binding-like beta-propeller repeat protein [Planctomycetota bacterium]|jgi:outer membrane protein assembly factor BamB|nr:PQQ-binding-like beta-propeller repeat protein [Planctomycetota bacterium]
MTTRNNARRGVVPVVAQAGTALAPLIAVGVTNTIGLLLKPRELIRVLKAKPWILLILAAIAGGAWGLYTWITAPAESRRGGTTVAVTGAATGTDWSKVALEIIRQRAMAPIPSAPASQAAADPLAADATQTAIPFRGNNGRSGHMGGPAPRGLQTTWAYYPYDDRFNMILSSPLVAGGMVYGASCQLDPEGGSFGAVFCLDATTGVEQWLCEVAAPGTERYFTGFYSSPALSADGQSLIIGQGLHTDFDAELLCLDAATGAVRWTVATPLHLESSPAIEGDLVVIGAGAVENADSGKPEGDPDGRGNPGFVLGVRISTGEVVFRAPVADPESAPILHQGICYIGSGLNGSRVVALRTESDAELAAAGLKRVLWDVPSPFPATGPITLIDDTVLVGCGKGDIVHTVKDPEGRVLALDAATGATKWTVDMPDAVLGPIAVDGHFAAVPCRNGELVAIDIAAEGSVLWRSRIKDDQPILAGAAIAGESVYALTNTGFLAIFERSDGTQVERHFINDRAGEMKLTTSAPIIAEGSVFVGSETGGLRRMVGAAP